MFKTILLLSSFFLVLTQPAWGKTFVGPTQVVEAPRTQTANTIFETASTTKAAISCPVMTNTQMNAVSSPVAGMCVYNSTNNQKYVYNGASWLASVMTTAGDIIYGGTSGLPTRLAVGAAGQVLATVSGAPAWQNAFPYATTATAAGTTTLTVASTFQQFFTGATTQTVVLPDATTLVLGQTFLIVNNSTGVVTVNKNGGTLAQYMAGNSMVRLTVTNIGTAAGTWAAVYQPFLRQFQQGTAQTSNGSVTSATFADPTNQPTITFTAAFTGRYRIYCAGVAGLSTATPLNIRLNNSVGGATISFSQEAVFDGGVSSGARTPFYTYVIAQLTAGTSYTFTLQAKSSSGTVNIYSASPTNGIAIMAEQIE